MTKLRKAVVFSPASHRTGMIHLRRFVGHHLLVRLMSLVLPAVLAYGVLPLPLAWAGVPACPSGPTKPSEFPIPCTFDDKLIDNREDRLNRLLERIPERNGVSTKGKPAHPKRSHGNQDPSVIASSISITGMSSFIGERRRH